MSHFHNSGLNTLVAALQQVSTPYKSTNGMTVVALCPCHDDRNPSLFITEKSNGTPLIICRGCGVSGAEVASSVGMAWIEVVDPNKKHGKPYHTGHAHAALVDAASRIAADAFAVVSNPNALQEEVRLTLARAAGALRGITEELRRADK